MAKNKTYSDKLKDPRWQKKRLEILERDKWTCQICGDTEQTLHIHHKCYEYGKDPWEYDNYVLSTICSNCHEWEHDMMQSTAESMIRAMRRAGLVTHGFIRMQDFFNASFELQDKEIIGKLMGFVDQYIEETKDKLPSNKDLPF